ncbi:cytochrome P450 [Blastococcus sp. MG754426]|uniref:cytochrome P450 n=1 Tax=unclassified Blastococcus TaxID=2619396 RepID=UPI001EF01699|nr:MULTISPECIES: cytochrome P450 [unclassified Blastococcus]MCF6509043.1 cytochrome P450 [Blastococcus sp. MG754426]MCF6512188.1 cytochrome P450 [Blastococcus sp. MG754427]
MTATAEQLARPARTAARWAVRHGLPAVYLSRSARRGDAVGRLMRDRALREQPYALYEELRARGPLTGSSLGLVTTSHPVAQEVLRSDRFGVGWDRSAAPRVIRWALAFGDDPAAAGVAEPPSMLVVDPPDHTRFRRLVSRAFTPRATAAFEPAVRRTAERLLDDLEGRDGVVDLVDAYAAQLPVLVIAELLGVPVERREDFLRWGAAAAATLDPGLPLGRFLAAERALRAMHRFLAEHFDRLRREPGADLVSRLVTLPPDEALTDRELHATVLLLLGAGFETTVNLLGNAVVLLDAHRDQWAALRGGDASWEDAVEEVLRLDSPVQLTGRTARADVELAGRRVAAGMRVTLLLGAANRDPDVFPDPARFDVTRANAREHLAFSGGIHYCLGAGLARLEGAVGLQVLGERFPGLRVAGRPVRRDLQTLRGFAALPVTLR